MTERSSCVADSAGTALMLWLMVSGALWGYALHCRRLPVCLSTTDSCQQVIPALLVWCSLCVTQADQVVSMADVRDFAPVPQYLWYLDLHLLLFVLGDVVLTVVPQCYL
jgi:hypothetical protein